MWEKPVKTFSIDDIIYIGNQDEMNEIYRTGVNFFIQIFL